MNPDTGSPTPPPGFSQNPDPEILLRGLRFRPLPDSWRAEILRAADTAAAAEEEEEPAPPPAGQCPRPSRPWFHRPLFQGLAAAWAVIGVLRLTTPSAPSPTPPQMLAMPGLPGGPTGSGVHISGFQLALADADRALIPNLNQP